MIIIDIEQEKYLRNAIKDARVIKVSHIDTNVLKNDGTIENALETAENDGFHSGFVTVSQIEDILTDGRDKKESAAQYVAKVWKDVALRDSRLLNVCFNN